MLPYALSKTTEVACMRELHVGYDSQDAICALGRLLSRAGDKLISLRIELENPELHWGWHKETWIDLLRDTWKTLNIASCTSLESIRIPIYLNQEKYQRSQKNLAEPVTNIMKESPPTLKTVTISVDRVQDHATLNNPYILNLHRLDAGLVKDRFPQLVKIQIDVRPDWNMGREGGDYWQKCMAAVQRALPNLHAHGLLKTVEY
ncbi:hypothetical protein C8Q74DRAFT_1294542 [Fomes fomentarius]|nr:hypothetical protein C8Q74DRAFT_1294542 [Fomes fomentarius]